MQGGIMTTTKTNVNDIEVDVNHVAEDLVQRRHEDKIYEDRPYNATGLVLSLLEDKHDCLDSVDCDWYAADDGAPVVTDCVLDDIAQEQINTVI